MIYLEQDLFKVICVLTLLFIIKIVIEYCKELVIDLKMINKFIIMNDLSSNTMKDIIKRYGTYKKINVLFCFMINLLILAISITMIIVLANIVIK